MTVNVNPPPQLRIPKAFLADREVREFVNQQNIILFQLWRKTGGNSDPISNIDNKNLSSFNSILQQLNKELKGLPELTCDTTGFTSDLTFITSDKVIA